MVAPEEEEQWVLKSSGVAGSLFLRRIRHSKENLPQRRGQENIATENSTFMALDGWEWGEGRIQCT